MTVDRHAQKDQPDARTPGQQAEDEHEDLYALRDQIHWVAIDIAQRVVDDGGQSQHLLDALRHASIARDAFEQAAHALVDDRCHTLELASAAVAP